MDGPFRLSYKLSKRCVLELSEKNVCKGIDKDRLITYISSHNEIRRNQMRTFMRISKALGDEQRVRILGMLQKGEMCVCQIIEVLGLAPSTVSKHLSILHSAGLVDSRKNGRWNYYRLPEGEIDPVVESALLWVRSSLRKDPLIVKELKKVAEICSLDPKVLCQRQRIDPNRRENYA